MSAARKPERDELYVEIGFSLILGRNCIQAEFFQNQGIDLISLYVVVSEQYVLNKEHG